MKKYLFTIYLLRIFIADGQDSVSTIQIETAEKLTGLHFTPVKRDSMASVLSDRIKTYNYLHAQNFTNDMPLPLWFNPVLPGMIIPENQIPVQVIIPDQVQLPKDRNQLAFFSIPQLASL